MPVGCRAARGRALRKAVPYCTYVRTYCAYRPRCTVYRYCGTLERYSIHTTTHNASHTHRHDARHRTDYRADDRSIGLGLQVLQGEGIWEWLGFIPAMSDSITLLTHSRREPRLRLETRAQSRSTKSCVVRPTTKGPTGKFESPPLPLF